jgi:hypothetical protein
MANGPDRTIYEREDFNRPQDRESFFERRDFDFERERDLRDEIAREMEDMQRDLDNDARRRFEAEMKRLTAEDVRRIVNDSNIMVTSDGRISSRRPSGRDVIRRSGQFAMQGFDLPVKKPRKKNKKHCKNLSQCLRQANAELRTKRGAIRKGKTQADIMRRAQKLLRKM